MVSQWCGMLEFYKRRKLKRVIYSWPVLLLMLIPVGYFMTVAGRAYLKEREAHENMLAATAELGRLKERQTMLNAEIARLSSDRGIEEELRDKYEVGKPGEHMILLVDPDKAQQDSMPPIKEKSFFGKLWEKIW